MITIEQVDTNIGNPLVFLHTLRAKLWVKVNAAAYNSPKLVNITAIIHSRSYDIIPDIICNGETSQSSCLELLGPRTHERDMRGIIKLTFCQLVINIIYICSQTLIIYKRGRIRYSSKCVSALKLQIDRINFPLRTVSQNIIIMTPQFEEYSVW